MESQSFVSGKLGSESNSLVLQRRTNMQREEQREREKERRGEGGRERKREREEKRRERERPTCLTGSNV